MEKVALPIIEQKSSDEDVPALGTESGAHEEALQFVEAHRDFFEHYARGKVTFAPAPPGLDTFAFDLNTNTIYVNSRFYKKLGFSDEKTAFATLHEAEHFMEKKVMLTEEGGATTFGNYVKRIGKSEAYGLMDNCVADIRENSAVVAKTNPGFRTIEEGLYREELFKETDFTASPRHVQFCQALLREGRIPDEACTLAQGVRAKLDALRDMKDEEGESLLDIFTNPDVPMSYRLQFQNQYVWPIVKALLDEDMKERKEQQSQGGDKGKPGDGEEGEGGGAKQGEGKEKEGEGQEAEGGGKSQKGKAPPKGGKEQPPNPNDVFRDAYDAAKKQVLNAVPVEALAKAFEEWKKEHAKDPLDEADKAYADAIGVKKEELRAYRNIVERLENTRNPETGENVMEELRALVRRIIAERVKPGTLPRYPTEEGEELVDPAELVAQVKAGNLEPRAWQTQEMREKRGEKFGEVELTAIFDRSASMVSGGKLRAQQEAGVLWLEALKEFADVCDEERVNMDAPLEVRTEAYAFQADAMDGVPIKKMSKELGEAERIRMGALLGSAPGESTPDFVPLDAILRALSDEVVRKIADGELKKIVIVFTDGDSDDPRRVQSALEALRGKGVVVVGVGITESASSVLTTYAPGAQVVAEAIKLPQTLGDLLKEHLANV